MSGKERDRVCLFYELMMMDGRNRPKGMVKFGKVNQIVFFLMLYFFASR